MFPWCMRGWRGRGKGEATCACGCILGSQWCILGSQWCISHHVYACNCSLLGRMLSRWLADAVTFSAALYTSSARPKIKPRRPHGLDLYHPSRRRSRVLTWRGTSCTYGSGNTWKNTAPASSRYGCLSRVIQTPSRLKSCCENFAALRGVCSKGTSRRWWPHKQLISDASCLTVVTPSLHSRPAA